ncbi:MAG: DUF4340 domain-containing protein [Thiotrichaceae bacterium]
MRNRWFLNFVLLIVASILSLLVIFTPGLEKPAPEQLSLTELNTKQVKHIRIETLGKDVIELSKDAQDTWQITAPLALEANEFRINSILELLTTKRYQKLEADTVKLDELQLTPAKMKVSFDNLTIALGTTSPVDETKRYVQINETVYLVTDTFYEFLAGEAVKFANLSILGKNPKITELQTPNYHLISENGTWKLSENKEENVETGTDTLNAMVDNWQHAQAISVNAYQESVAQGEVSVKLGDNTLKFQLISISPEFILALPEKKVQYQLANHQVEKLLHLPIKKSALAPTTPTNGELVTPPADAATPMDTQDEPTEPVDPNIYLDKEDEDSDSVDSEDDTQPPVENQPSPATPEVIAPPAAPETSM